MQRKDAVWRSCFAPSAKEIRPNEPIRCILDTDHSTTEISLAENAIRTGMHPADQYEAFAKLHGKEGMSARRQQTQNQIALRHFG